MLWAPEEAGIGPFGSGGEGNSLTPDPQCPFGSPLLQPRGLALPAQRSWRSRARGAQPAPSGDRSPPHRPRGVKRRA